MAGIDWKSANMDKREAFSFTGSQVARLCRVIRQMNGVDGCVLLATCNRTELYLSGADLLAPARVLCRAAGAQGEESLFFPNKICI